MNVVLHMDSDEEFFPLHPEALATEGVLVRKHSGQVHGKRVERPGLGFLALPTNNGGFQYADGVRATEDDYLDWPKKGYAKASFDLEQKYPPVLFRFRDPTGCEQFWFFYLYSNRAVLGFGLHEGDWEGFNVYRDKTVVTAAHAHGVDAGKVSLEPLNLYVAQDSHATYPKPGKWMAPPSLERANGDGRKLVFKQPFAFFGGWAKWPGRWGSSDTSPRSPLCQQRGTDSEAYRKHAQRSHNLLEA